MAQSNSTGQSSQRSVSGLINTNEEGDDQRIFQLDPCTLESITKEIDEMSKVTLDDIDLDAAGDDISELKPDDLDGPSFYKFVARQLKKFSCVSGQADMASESYDLSKSESNNATSHTEDATSYTESYSYNFNHTKRGLAVVINNESFSNKSLLGNRRGSSCDAAILKHTLDSLGFKVMVLTDLSAKKMLKGLQQVARMYDHRQADCFVCVVMTHGGQTNEDKVSTEREDILLGTDGEPVKTTLLVDMFTDTKCPGLKGKPRLFFLQACRGEKMDPGHKVYVHKPKSLAQHTVQPASMGDKQDAVGEETVGGAEGGPTGGGKTDALPVKTVQNVPVRPVTLHKDFLIMYATPPGYYAWRSTNGSCFIQSLCKVLLRKSVPETSLLSLLVQVTGVVAREYESHTPRKPKMHQMKVCPVTEHMLVKDIYLTKKNPCQT